MAFLAIVGIAGVTVTLNTVMEEAEPRCWYREAYREEEAKKDEEEEEPVLTLSMFRGINQDSLKLAY
jgi:hypothetical protein